MRVCKDVIARKGELGDSMTNFDVRMIQSDAFVEIRRKLDRQQNRAQHNGRGSIVPQLFNNSLQLATEDTQCKKTIVTFMCEAISEAGCTATSGNTETIADQLRPVAHVAPTCGTSFTDTLRKIVQQKQVIALFTM